MFPPLAFSSNSTAAGDRTPGDSTTNMPSIASTTLLLLHDVRIPDRRLGNGWDLPLNMVSWSFKNLTTTSWLAPLGLVYIYNYCWYLVSIEMHSALHGTHTYKNVLSLCSITDCSLFWGSLMHVLWRQICIFLSAKSFFFFWFCFRPEGWNWSLSKILIENQPMFLSCFASQVEKLLWSFPLKQIKSSSFFILTWFHNKEIDINKHSSLHFLFFF